MARSEEAECMAMDEELSAKADGFVTWLQGSIDPAVRKVELAMSSLRRAGEEGDVRGVADAYVCLVDRLRELARVAASVTTVMQTSALAAVAHVRVNARRGGGFN
jgi:hypothetical protein